MSDVYNAQTALRYLNFVRDNIFNVVNNDSNLKNNIIFRINSGELEIPIDLKPFVFKYLGMTRQPNRSPYKKLCGEKLHEYLIKRVSIEDPKKIKFPCYSTRNINELTKFLQEDGQLLLKFNERTLFYNQCRFGYVLERLFYLHKEKHQKKEIKESFFIFLSKYLKISASYARKLRTVGKIWYEYKGLGNLAISFIEFYRHKNEIILLLKNYHNLAQHWKDVDDTDELSNLFLDVSDFNNNISDGV